MWSYIWPISACGTLAWSPRGVPSVEIIGLFGKIREKTPFFSGPSGFDTPRFSVPLGWFPTGQPVPFRPQQPSIWNVGVCDACSGAPLALAALLSADPVRGLLRSSECHRPVIARPCRGARRPDVVVVVFCLRGSTSSCSLACELWAARWPRLGRDGSLQPCGRRWRGREYALGWCNELLGTGELRSPSPLVGLGGVRLILASANPVHAAAALRPSASTGWGSAV